MTFNNLFQAYELWKEGKGMKLMDPSLEDCDSSCKLTRCLQIALLCVQENADDRPSMLEISSMLKTPTSEFKVPQSPAFSIKKIQDHNEDDHSQITIEPQTYSVCSATVTDVTAR